MDDQTTQQIHADISGQDDNLGDSALRRGYLSAIAGAGRRFHVVGRMQTSDYLSGLALSEQHIWYADRDTWVRSVDAKSKIIHVFNAGEIDLAGVVRYPTPRRADELAAAKDSGGVVIAAGIGLKDPRLARSIEFRSSFLNADVVSWRDAGSQQAAGFGEVNPDWAFMLGSKTADWRSVGARSYIAVTLRFDRPYPDSRWIAAVKSLANATSTRIVTLAQVSRDAPRAVQLAVDLGGEYLAPRSLAHDVLEAHVRGIYQQSLAVVSDRAHGLIIGATEGAYPIGSGADPGKIVRLLDAVGLGTLIGHFDQLQDFGEQLPTRLRDLAPAVDEARARLARLTLRIQAVLGSVMP
ncbi:polysaccharide pyruvyl transferase family protein [Microbacterium protaetiae]|uniref:polysaccharide pyruvyl transferase family protein n=1 Tax=Microbacterium protaetiae TaxID=2509458 RepID=UPI001F5CE05D|nr:polysaccharide pyruvyl transferase family protein [Microbacterium protaetiae]